MEDCNMNGQTTIDEQEVARFSAMAAEWWDPSGKFRPLHKFNPVRLAYIKERVCNHFGRDEKDAKAFKGLRFLDIGCGGGLLSEPMARLGAEIIGADASATNIEIAKIHAQETGLDIDYRATTSELLATDGEKFDVVLNMEVVEHVADVSLYMQSCNEMVKEGGLTFVSTINRTAKARFLALFMAEKVLRWLPIGTHDYNKLVTPDELRKEFSKSSLAVLDETGVAYNPFFDRWLLSADMDVNYMILAGRKSEPS